MIMINQDIRVRDLITNYTQQKNIRVRDHSSLHHKRGRGKHHKVKSRPSNRNHTVILDMHHICNNYLTVFRTLFYP